MSKTIRRKNISNPYKKDPENYKLVDGVLMEWSISWSDWKYAVWPRHLCKLMPEDYCERINRVFHTDNQDTMNAPASFRRKQNQMYRRQMLQELNKSLIEDDSFDPGETFSNRKPKKNANWLWW